MTETPDMPPQKSPPKKSAVKRFLPLGVLALGLVLFFGLGLNDYVSFAWLAENYTAIKETADAQRLLVWGAFFILYVITVAFSLPIASLLTLGGGAILGWPAAFLVVTSATLGSFIIFLAAKGAMAETLAQKAGPFMKKLNEGFNESPFFWLLALRLFPVVPFWAANIAPGLLGMKSRQYLLATAVGIAPGTCIYVWVGKGFDTVLASGQTPDLSSLSDPAILAPLAALGGLSLVPIIVQRFRKKKES